MKYEGLLYGKVGRKYVPLEHPTDYYDNIEKKIKLLKKAYGDFCDIWGNGGNVDDTDIALLLDAIENLVIRED